MNNLHFENDHTILFEQLEPRLLLSASVLEIEANPVAHTGLFAEVTTQESAAAEFEALALLAAPSSFDLRTGGYVTSVKNQGDCGSCWTFATYGSLESSILLAGGPTRDLSENHLKNEHGFDWGPCDGGNSYISEAYLSRGSGPVDEADDPYHDWNDRPSPGGPSQYYVREALWFDTDDEMKDAVMTYGALYTSMYMDTAYYNSSDYTYYYPGKLGGNHAVTIVGWDDAKVTDAPQNGAWLIKNSWGASWGDAGYFWIAYRDTMGANSAVSFSDAVPPETFSDVYYHDDFGNVSSLNSPYALNAFTPTVDEDLLAVGFWTQADGASYDVRLYDTFSGGSLSDLLASTTGTSTYAGYHTIDLPAAVPLTASDSFYVYLNITGGGDYPMSVDHAYPDYSSASTASAGESYYSFDGIAWTDLTTWDSTANFGIKALASYSAVRTPWLAGVTEDSVYVSVETPNTATVTVDYGLDASYGSTATTENTQTTGSTYVHNVKLTSLLPNTEYHYRVVYGATVTADNTFWTAPEPGTSVRWGFAADSRTNTAIHNDMAGLIATFDPRMMVYGGDLCDVATYSSWDNEWFVPNQEALNATTPWVNSPGNHEGWNWLTQAFTQSPAGDEPYYSFDYGDAHILVLNTEISDGPGSALWDFAEADLAATAQTWKIVAFHKPAYTAGGHSQDADMLAMTSALFEPYGVDIVLSGHNHYYQHNLANGIHHMVIGSFGAPLYSPGSEWFTVYSEMTESIAIFDMTPTTLTLTTYRDDGSLIETIELTAGTAPVAVDDAYDATADTTLNVDAANGVLDNDSDPQGDPLTAVLETDVTDGVLNLNADGSFEYTPNAAFIGTDTFTYKAYDGSEYSNTATVTITVFEESPVEVIIDNADGAGVTVTGDWVTSSWAGTQYGADYLHDNTTGKGTKSVRFTPTLTAAARYDVYMWYPYGTVYYTTNVPVDIIYGDRAGGTVTATVTVNQTTPGGQWELLGTYAFDAGTTGSVLVRTDGTVKNVVADAVKFTPVPPSPPVAVDDAYGAVKEAMLSVDAENGVLANDDDPDDDSLEAELVADVSDGTLALNSDGSFDYTPDAAFTGTDTFTYKAYDGSEYSNVATVTIAVFEESPVEVIIDNADGTGVTITGDWVTSTWAGTQYGADYLHDNTTGKGTKSVRFTPTLTGAGEYDVYMWYPYGTLYYTTNVPVDIIHSDGAGGTTTETVTVNQTTPGGQWELLGTYAFDAGTAGGVLVRTDGTVKNVAADAVKFTPHVAGAVIIDNTAGAGVTITGDWVTSSWAGTQYGANYLHDNATGKGTKSVRFTPTLAAGTYEVYMWYPYGTLYYTTNVPVDIIHSDGVGGTTTETVTVNQTTPGGQWELLGTYAFDAGTAGSVLVRTGGTVKNVVADAVKFTPVPPGPPVAADDAYGAVKEVMLSVGAENGVLANDDDPDDDPLEAELVADVSDGTLALNADGSFDYTPDAAFTGTDTFTYKAYDGSEYSNVATVTITVFEDNPVEVIIDNGDVTGVTITGDWVTSAWAGTQYGANYLHDDATGKGEKSVRFTPTLTAAGSYDVYMWYPYGTLYYTTNVPVDIIHSDGAGGTTTETVTVDQTTPGGQWELLGTYAFDAGTAGGVLVRTDGTVKNVVADAVKFTPHVAGEVIIDNTAGAGVTITGDWVTSSWAGTQYGANYLHDNTTGKGEKSVRFTPTLAAGTYEVYMWYPYGTLYYTTNVPVDIIHSDGVGGTTTETVTVDQTTPGGQWELLGTYLFDAGTAGSVLVRTDGTVKNVVADAVKFTPV